MKRRQSGTRLNAAADASPRHVSRRLLPCRVRVGAASVGPLAVETTMLPLDDKRWSSLDGGYRVPFDASVPLRQLEHAENLQPIWDELWNELHHQGHVGVASYAAVPHLVRIARARNL